MVRIHFPPARSLRTISSEGAKGDADRNSGSAALDKTDGHEPVAIGEAPHLAVQLKATRRPTRL